MIRFLALTLLLVVDSCSDRSWVEEVSGYTCPGLMESLRCDEELRGMADMFGVNIPEELSEEITDTTTLADICEMSCGACDIRTDMKKIQQEEVCGDNALVVEVSGFACDQLMQFLQCNTDLRGLALEWGVPIPEEYSSYMPQGTTLGDICPATCNMCGNRPQINTASLTKEKCYAAPGYCLLCNGCLTGSGCPPYCFSRCAPFSQCAQMINLEETSCDTLPAQCNECLPACLANPKDYVFGTCEARCRSCLNWSHCFNPYGEKQQVILNPQGSSISYPATQSGATLTVVSDDQMYYNNPELSLSRASIPAPPSPLSGAFNNRVKYLHPGVSPCGDFPLLIDIAGVDCPDFVNFLSCGADIREVLANYGFEVPHEFRSILPQGLMIGDLCPASCGVCQSSPIDGVHIEEEGCLQTPLSCLSCMGCMNGEECPDFCLFGCAVFFKCPKILAKFLEPLPCRQVPLKCLRCAKCISEGSPCPGYCIAECAAFQHCGDTGIRGNKEN
eukprot:GHVL01033947.1.p1 GENE.GHVL01033947.1~~GHVL01033947.1.p1  ORF type:complete len:503 (+),score=82.32 GHVL01033947.1:81-1589(+)